MAIASRHEKLPACIFGPRVDTGTRSCAPMINRNRQKPTLRDADVVRSRNIANKFSFECGPLSLSFSPAESEIPFFHAPFSHSLITFSRPDPRKRVRLVRNDWCTNVKELGDYKMHSGILHINRPLLICHIRSWRSAW